MNGILFDLLFIVLGLIVVIKSADWLVDGASAIAGRLGVAPLMIGLTVVAFGTSAPEFVVSFLSAVRGESSLALGNIMGSVGTNILLGLGIAAVIRPLKVTSSTVWREIPFGFFAVAILFLLMNDQFVPAGGVPQLSWVDGVVLLALFVLFMAYAISVARGSIMVSTSERREMEKGVDENQRTFGISAVLIMVGLIGLLIGGEWIVQYGVRFAETLGMSAAVVGLFVTGPGTSLPEIVTSIVAVRKATSDIAVGGIVGSNIFNVLFILGVSSVVAPIVYQPDLVVEWIVIIAAHAMLWAALFIGQKHTINRWQGVVFIITYIATVVWMYLANAG